MLKARHSGIGEWKVISFGLSALTCTMGSSVKIRIELVEGQFLFKKMTNFHVRGYEHSGKMIIDSGPFKTYQEAFDEWSTAHPDTLQKDKYMAWREQCPRHAWALENTENGEKVPEFMKHINDGGGLTQRLMDKLWGIAGKLEGKNREKQTWNQVRDEFGGELFDDALKREGFR